MKTFDVPDWIIAPFIAQGVSESDYFLYGAGRALGFVRMAAYALDREIPSSQFKVAEYHTYTGISAARTAIDATAAWINAMLDLGVSPGYQINLSRKDFRAKVSEGRSGVKEYCQALGDLGEGIDKHRQRAQHREGPAICYHSSIFKEKSHLVGWYLMPEGLSDGREADLRLADLLKRWADDIEGNLQGIHKVIVMASGDTQVTGLETEG